jgi:hypothetical protein
MAISKDDRERGPAEAPPGDARTPPADRYEPPRILKKRAVARIASTFSGAGPGGGPPILVGDG